MNRCLGGQRVGRDLESAQKKRFQSAAFVADGSKSGGGRAAFESATSMGEPGKQQACRRVW
jgi:hypothetical protein